MQAKTELRQKLRQLRLALADRDARSAAIYRHLCGSEPFMRSNTVLLYVSYGSEVGTRDIFAEAIRSGKRAVVPYCCGGNLQLFSCFSLDELVPGAHDIPEPDARTRSLPERQVPVTELDLALLPGLGFTASGFRLGQGKGYYDRLLADLPASCATAGLCFAVQLIAELPLDSWDKPVQFVVTENGIIDAGQRQP